MKTANRLNGIGEYYFSQKLREIDDLNRQGKRIINLGIGSPDLPPHPDVIRELQEEAARPVFMAIRVIRDHPCYGKQSVNGMPNGMALTSIQKRKFSP